MRQPIEAIRQQVGPPIRERTDSEGLARDRKAWSSLWLVVALASIAFPSRALAATLIVDGAGGTPYRTVGAAIADANYGDVILVRSGVYEEQIQLGPGASLLDLRCESPDLVTLRNPLGNTVLVGQNTTARIDGCTISGAGVGVALRSGAHALVRNSVIANNSHGIMNVEAAVGSLTVSNSTIAMNALSGIYLDGCGVLNTIAATVVENSIVFANGDCGISRDSRSTCSNPVPALAYNNFALNGTNYCGVAAGLGSISSSPGFINQLVGDFRLRLGSASKQAGRPVPADNNPDGSRNDLGAYGGPGAASFLAYGDVPRPVAELALDPSGVPANGTLRLTATGAISP